MNKVNAYLNKKKQFHTTLAMKWGKNCQKHSLRVLPCIEAKLGHCEYNI